MSDVSALQPSTPSVPPSALAGGEVTAPNLYVHFPFCRRKCAYCVLHSRCGVSEAERADYVAALARTVRAHAERRGGPFSTVYFGGGSPGLCDLRPLFDALAPCLGGDAEFTVELHPLDASDATLATLKAGGVNRISMGVQSLDDATLLAMGRSYAAADAARAFARVKGVFDNAGIDLIVGYPFPRTAAGPLTECEGCRRLADWGLRHCSAYSLQLEEGSILSHQVRKGAVELPSDEETLDRLRDVAAALESIGLLRYEISNYAQPGFECRHNLATWRGEDYLGLGEGAAGRLGCARTHDGIVAETVDEESDWVERRIFRLRLREGLDLAETPASDWQAARLARWRTALDRFVGEGLLMREGARYRLTGRGQEVCDTILAELV